MNTDWPTAQEEYDTFWKTEEKRGLGSGDFKYRYIPMDDTATTPAFLNFGLPTILDSLNKPFSRKEIGCDYKDAHDF